MMGRAMGVQRVGWFLGLSLRLSKYCSECGNELVDDLAFTEEGQEDHPWCRVCTDYCDALERPHLVTQKSPSKRALLLRERSRG